MSHDRESPGRARARRIAGIFVAAALAAAHAPAYAEDEPRPGADEPPQFNAVVALERAWPDHPEWLAMFVDILQGSQLGPEDGWFRKAVARSRYDWEGTRARLDGDGDGRVSRREFPGSDPDFARLDRNSDGVLDEPDFDFSAHALTPSPGAMLFYRADADGNGKLTAEEFAAFFEEHDTDGLGFLSLSDAQEALNPPPRGRGSSGGPSGPDRLTLLKGLARQEIGSLQPGPAVGESAPDFTLRKLDGGGEVRLSDVVGPRPVVLVFGNFTCGPFRSQAGNVEKVYRRYKDRATFLMVYVREAHPTDGWSMESNSRVGVELAQPRTYDERVQVAQQCSSRLELGFPMLVDAMHDPVGARYSGMPSRLYVIDRDGRVAYKSGRGPFGFKPREMEQSLILVLSESDPGTPVAAEGP